MTDKKPDGTLFYTTLRVLKRPLLAAAFPRLCLIGFSFAQPFLINRAILFASSPDTPENRNVGYGLIGAFVLVYIGIAVSFEHNVVGTTGTNKWFEISSVQYEYRMYRAATMIRGCLIPCIYRKTLTLETSEVSPAAALTLISTDIETIKDGIVHLHEVWASPIEIALAIYLLQRQVGAASAIPIAFAIGMRKFFPQIVIIWPYSLSCNGRYYLYGNLHGQSSSEMDPVISRTSCENSGCHRQHQMD